MLSNLFTLSTGDVTSTEILISGIASLILGVIIALCYKATSKYTKNFLITLTLLPFLVAMVILMVNGSVGTSIAILGAFSLVRFRSIPGTSKEIVSVFFAMTVGLAAGMCNLALASIIAVVGCIAIALFSKIKLFERGKEGKLLNITVPEDLDYTNIFDEEFSKYTKSYELISSKTSNMGSLFNLKYRVSLKNDVSEKNFIDALRVKNGNLKITLSQELEGSEDL